MSDFPASSDGYTHITTSRTYCTRKDKETGWTVCLPEGYSSRVIMFQYQYILEVFDKSGKKSASISTESIPICLVCFPFAIMVDCPVAFGYKEVKNGETR